jgi:hypothetical protein
MWYDVDDELFQSKRIIKTENNNTMTTEDDDILIDPNHTPREDHTYSLSHPHEMMITPNHPSIHLLRTIIAFMKEKYLYRKDAATIGRSYKYKLSLTRGIDHIIDCTIIREEFRNVANRYTGPTRDFIAFCQLYSDHLEFFEQAEQQLKSFIRYSTSTMKNKKMSCIIL